MFALPFLRDSLLKSSLDRCANSHFTWSGYETSFSSYSRGGLASQAKNPEAPLLAVVKDASQSRLACVRSDDQGNTWKDWAVSEEITNPYAIGTCREITADGAAIGTFTSAIDPSNDNVGKSKLYFFRIPIGL